MKKIFFAPLIALLLSMPAYGQVSDDQPGNIDERADEITERLTNVLALSEEQREDVYDATADMLEDKAEMDKDDTRGEIQKEYDKDLSKILNDEQYQQYMESAERKAMMNYNKMKAENKAKY